MKIKRFIQLFLAKFLDSPEIDDSKNIGYSLVRSEKSNCSFAAHTSVWPPYFLRRVTLGDYSYINRNAMASFLTVGKYTSIGPNFCCGLGRHPINGISTSPVMYRNYPVEVYKWTTIGNDVFIGANVTVLDGITIGDGAVIGAGAVVTRDIPPYAIAVGVPAKVIKYRFGEETIKTLLEKKWWNGSEEEIKRVGEYEFRVGEYVES